MLSRCVSNPAVIAHYFLQPDGEAHTAGFIADLAHVRWPTLVLAGDDDPITPVENSEDIIAALPPRIGRLVRFADTGHTVFDDEPRSYDAVREFIEGS